MGDRLVIAGWHGELNGGQMSEFPHVRVVGDAASADGSTASTAGQAALAVA
jgi:hypothetical protein